MQLEGRPVFEARCDTASELLAENEEVVELVLLCIEIEAEARNAFHGLTGAWGESRQVENYRRSCPLPLP
jgi:hypothetical protein